MMIYHSNMAEEALNKKIDETLERVYQRGDYGSSSDLYNVIRWAKDGKLQRKV